MSTTPPASAAHSRAAAPSCPTCESPLQPQGEAPLRYWTCRSCNLVYLA